MDENSLKEAAGLHVLKTFWAKLFLAAKGTSTWDAAGVGLMVWGARLNGSQYMKFMQQSDGRVLLDEELYENFISNCTFQKTNHGTHAFYTLEFEHSMAGVAFHADSDAQEFKKNLEIMGPQAKGQAGRMVPWQTFSRRR